MHTPGDPWDVLKHAAERLVAPGAPPGEVAAACNALHDLLRRVSGLDESNPAARRNASLPSGKVLGPVWAAYCLKDFLRTRAFARGILQAIRTARRRFPGTPVHVLYAGCGPFAGLILPVIPFLEKDEAVFTLLEIMPSSVVLLKKTLDAFGITPWVRAVVQADATTYQIDASSPVHVLVGEMMQAGLEQEPQVAVMMNLAPQVTPGGILVPECIALETGLLHPRRNQERMTQADGPGGGDVCRLLGPVFELSQTEIAQWKAGGVSDFPEIEIELPADRDPAFRQLALFTTMRVFGSERLGTWDCGLTQPLVVLSLSADQPVRSVGFQYQTGARPGMRYRVVW